MSHTPDEQVDLITQQFRKHHARMRLATVVVTLIPIVIGCLILVVAWRQASKMKQELLEVESQKEGLAIEIKEMETARSQLNAALEKLNREIEARQALFRRYESSLPATAVKMENALEQIRKGQYEPAIETYQDVLSADTGNDLADAGLGYTYLQTGQDEEALASLKRAASLNPSNAEVHYNMALAYWRLGRPESAGDALSVAIGLDSSLDARSHRDPMYAGIRDAMELTTGQATANDERERAAIEAGIKAAKEGRYRKAVSAYDRAIAINPKNAYVWNWRGYALYRDEQYADAVESLRICVRIDPDHSEAYYNLGLALWRSGEKKAAAAAVQRCFELNPEYRDRAVQDPNFNDLRRYLEKTAPA